MRSRILAGGIAALVVSAPSLLAQDAAAPRADISGHVTDTDGRPIEGATVFVYTAGPKVGTSSL